MKVYSYSEGRKKFSHLFVEAMKEGIIHIKNRDGLLFALIPEKGSPLDIPSIDVNLSKKEIIDLIHEGHERQVTKKA